MALVYSGAGFMVMLASGSPVITRAGGARFTAAVPPRFAYRA
jgi:hypothetical protein